MLNIQCICCCYFQFSFYYKCHLYLCEILLIGACGPQWSHKQFLFLFLYSVRSGRSINYSPLLSLSRHRTETAITSCWRHFQHSPHLKSLGDDIRCSHRCILLKMTFLVQRVDAIVSILIIFIHYIYGEICAFGSIFEMTVLYQAVTVLICTGICC